MKFLFLASSSEILRVRDSPFLGHDCFLTRFSLHMLGCYAGKNGLTTGFDMIVVYASQKNLMSPTYQTSTICNA